MKLKRIALILMITIIATTVASIFNVSYATESTNNVKSRYLTIKKLRASGYGYEALDKSIWKICESVDSTGNSVNYDHTIYCMKGGPGFGSEEFGSGTPQVKEYRRYFDMKNPSTITDSYASAIPSTSSDTYKSLLWLLENVYVAPKSNATTEEIEMAAEYRELLLKNAGIEGGYITDDDIDAVQQLAVWHFTNNDAYKVENSSNGTFEFWINAVAGTDSNYNALSDYDGTTLADLNGWDRAEECQALYDYLVDTAESMAKTYEVKTASQPYEIADTVVTQKTVGNNIVIGPFKVNRISDTEGTLVGTFKNSGTKVENPTIQYEDGTLVTSLESTVDQTTGTGKEFYLVFPSDTEIGKITFEISGSYFDTKITYWAVEGAPLTEQPVVEVERVKIPYSVENEFDLALRKFITAIGEEKLVDENGKYTREPQVTAEALKQLADGKVSTAVKEHTKTPVVVNTGDKVVYTIRVYNEGRVNGYVKEITDYLPEGLEFIPTSDSTINTENGWTNPSGDGKTMVTDKLSGAMLKAFDGTTLEYLDVQIECKVVASVQIGKVSLKNIAEITAHSDEAGNLTVKDYDSTPENLSDDQKANYNPETSEKGWGYEDDDDYEDLVILGERFDLALRKFITAIGTEKLVDESGKYTREPQVTAESLKQLADGKTTTAIKAHTKTPVVVKTGDIVTYTIRVYNEGKVDAYVKEITDYLPEGLKLVENNTTNTENGWTNPSGDGKTIVTDKLSGTILKAFDGSKLEYLDVEVVCEVIASVKSTDTVLKNIAEITAHSDLTGDVTVRDDDSTPENLSNDQKTNYNPGSSEQGWGYEDDDDYEDLVIIGKYFDLSLRKFITAIGEEELVDENGKYTSQPVADVTPLLNGQTTAIYNHNKTPVNVEVGDIVIYTIRVYNEGEVDGYVDEIIDHLPQWLQFINDEFNASYGWKVSSDGRTVTTNITSKNTEYSASRDTIYDGRTEEDDKVLLKGFDETAQELDYIDVKIKCRVKDSGISEKITNIAEITKSSDATGSNLKDRDNDSLVTLPTDETLPNYKDDEIARGDKYIPGQEDDDDFEKVIVQKFDLALRKFITGVNNQTISNRVPVFSMNSEGKMTYTHPKTPVEVATGDVVVYTLRVFNEGNCAGYASEIKDDLPEGLEYLPDNDLNKQYKWKMYKEDGTETTNVEEATEIRTDYLSKELIPAFNKNTMTMPSFKDVKIAFKVNEPNTSDRILINIAEITEDRDEKGDPVEDIDSTPDNDLDGEDDIDIEKVKVKYFDLALEKIITEYSFKKDGKTTVTKTGHKFGVQPEAIVKVELLNKHSIKTAVVKFKYQIKVTNEGEVAGYATEVKDYIPEGLKFVEKDNKNWKLSEDGKTVTTDQLKDKLLKPGESAVVEIVLQWINGEDNLGLKQNWAEISEDRDEDGDPVEDIDSTPDNKKEGEDDIDDARVILSIVTGIGENYIFIIAGILVILVAGLILIKKFVL